MQQLVLFNDSQANTPIHTITQEITVESIANLNCPYDAIQEIAKQYTDTVAEIRRVKPVYKTITIGGKTLLFAHCPNGYRYFVESFDERVLAVAIRDRLNQDTGTVGKAKRLRRTRRQEPLTQEEWEALPARPHLWLDGKLVEMQWNEQWRR